MPKYEVGDRVLAGAPYSDMQFLFATVMIYDGYDYGIKYDVDVDGHDLDGMAPPGHGWWISEDRILSLIDEFEDIEAEDISRLFEEDCYEP